jgi:hypothetical protein
VITIYLCIYNAEISGVRGYKGVNARNITIWFSGHPQRQEAVFIPEEPDCENTGRGAE